MKKISLSHPLLGMVSRYDIEAGCGLVTASGLCLIAQAGAADKAMSKRIAINNGLFIFPSGGFNCNTRSALSEAEAARFAEKI